jgi:serine O-acetyltransferase
MRLSQLSSLLNRLPKYSTPLLLGGTVASAMIYEQSKKTDFWEVKKETLLKTQTSQILALSNAHKKPPECSLNDLIAQSKIFCSDPILEEILGVERITHSNNIKELITQILSRDLGTMIKTKTYSLDNQKQKEIEMAVFEDIYKAVKSDPVKPTPFQVAVTFIGAKALMTHRFAHKLWQDGYIKEAKELTSAALSNYHINIHPSAKIATGIFIDHGFGVSIKENVTIDSGAYILHKAKIGAGTKIGKNAFIGVGAVINAGLKIGDNVTVAAGSHVTADIPDNTTVFGFYNDAGSCKIMPARLQIPSSVKNYYNNSTNDSAENLNPALTLDILKGMIPFNPNSHLTVNHLKKFYNICQNIPETKNNTIGHLALVANHITHAAWQKAHSDELSNHQKTAICNFALWMQGRIATLFKVDIHPAVCLGENVMFPDDIKRGIVIGATATIGNNVYIGDGVTLGGNGKERGDRHPKISDNCYIGDNVSIIGAGKLGAGSIIMPDTVLILPIETITQNNRIWAGIPAIDVTEKCKKNHDFQTLIKYIASENT